VEYAPIPLRGRAAWCATREAFRVEISIERVPERVPQGLGPEAISVIDGTSLLDGGDKLASPLPAWPVTACYVMQANPDSTSHTGALAVAGLGFILPHAGSAS
jgi:hypothetical protein